MKVMLVFVLLAVPITASAQSAADRLLQAADENRNEAISTPELEMFFQKALPPALADLGLASTGPESITAVVMRVMNIFGARTKQRDGMVPKTLIPMLLPVKLYERLDLTVSDLVVARRTPAQPAEGGVEKALALFDLRQSALDDQSFAKPAKVSYTSFDRADETRSGTTPLSQWKVHGALMFASPSDLPGTGADRLISLTPIAAYDVQLDGGIPANDAITHRIGVFGAAAGGKLITGHVFQMTADWQTDRRYDAAAIGYSWFYSPNAPHLALGTYVPIGSAFLIGWRPYVGGVSSRVHRPANVTALQTRPDYDNLFGKVTVDGRVKERLAFTPIITQWNQLDGEKKHYWNYDLNGRYILSMTGDKQERASLEASYGHGEDSPLFKHRGRFDLGIGIKF